MTKFFKSKLFLISGVIAVTVSALVGGTIYFDGQNSKSAQAASNATLFPGQNALFTVTYANDGDVTPADNAILNIYIGDKLEVNPNTFIDQFDNGPKNCINPSFLQSFGSDGTSTNGWGNLLKYRPRSANTGTSSCSGTNIPGDADIGMYSEKRGQVTFEARLKSTITDPVGTILRPDNKQGVLGSLLLGKGNGVSGEITITVAQKTSTSSAASSVPIVSSSVPFPPSLPTSSSSSANNKVVNANEIDTAFCSPDPLTIGQKAICYFRLRDQTANYSLPSGGIKSGIESATGSSDNCVLATINNVKMLQCNNTPSDGGTPNSQKIKFIDGNNIDNTKGNIMLISAQAQNFRDGRLYFVGMDNKELKWDESVRYNLNFPINQKFKDGNVKLVFDQIGDTVPGSEKSLWSSGSCTFVVSAHTTTTVFRTYQGTISGGKCEANYPVNDQTIYNYHHVTVRATQPNSNKVITDTNVLVLYVGLNPTTTGGAVL